MLRFFFDDPPVAERLAPPDSTLAAQHQGADESPADSGPPRVAAVLHAPYADRDCAACHAVLLSGQRREKSAVPGVEKTRDRSGARLLLPPDELCVECHEELSAESLEEDGYVVHAPAAAGECLECHRPHKSRHESLLRTGDPFETVCFSCHEPEDVLELDPHIDLEPEERRCIDCHHPHASDEEHLLR